MISVIIPAFNCEDTITRVLNSVKSQTRFDLIKEVIVVNDGSTDNTLCVLNNYRNYNTDFPLKIINKENGGVSSARNMGLKHANQDWVALLDSDDEWLPNKIEKQLYMIKKYPFIYFIGTGRNKEELKFGKKIEDNLYKIGVKDLLKKTWPHTSTTLIKKSIFEDIDTFDEDRSYAEDGQLWLKIASIHPLYYISESLEIAGGNKISYGVKGLSSNLKEMHIGCLHNINEVYERNDINYIEKCFYTFFENIKYVKRILLTAWRIK